MSDARDAGISVVVPSIRAGSVSETIDSIRRQTHEDWELIVVMQGRDDALQTLVRDAEASDARIHGVWIPDRGVSRARNAGVRSAEYDTIVFIDDDCVAEPDWLAHLAATLAVDPSVGFVAGSLVAPPHDGWKPSSCPESIPGDFTFRPTEDHQDLPPGALFVSANLAARREAWDRVGPFDEELGAGMPFRGGEDLDLLIRIVAACEPIRFTPESVVHHTWGRRHGVKAVIGLSTSYASGQGAVAAKLTMAKGTEDAWRKEIRNECLWEPLRRLRWHRIPPRLVRLVAFERAYRRCMRNFTVNESMLVPATRSG